MSFQFNEQDPLARCAGETQKANDALNDYWLMGSGRSICKLLVKYEGQLRDEDGITPPTVHKTTIDNWSSDYRWQDRVACARRLENEAEREMKREQRKQLLDGLLAKTAEGLQRVDVQNPSLRQVTGAVRTVVQELRAEYDDLPTQRSEVSGPGGGPVKIISIGGIDPDEDI